MGKYSSFERNPRDFYPTPKEAVVPLLNFLPNDAKYIEPCAGDGTLVRHLAPYASLVEGFDIEPLSEFLIKKDALSLTEEDVRGADYVITNPPWNRKILHPMIEHFRSLVPSTWLLFDANWAHTRQATPYLGYCRNIVSVGRVKWIPGTKMTGKEDCCWYEFRDELQPHTYFHPRRIES